MGRACGLVAGMGGWALLRHPLQGLGSGGRCGQQTGEQHARQVICQGRVVQRRASLAARGMPPGFGVGWRGKLCMARGVVAVGMVVIVLVHQPKRCHKGLARAWHGMRQPVHQAGHLRPQQRQRQQGDSQALVRQTWAGAGRYLIGVKLDQLAGSGSCTPSVRR